jgi:flagellar biosynthetic protein FlhB
MAEQQADSTEQATPYRLEQARKEGNVAKSVDFNACALLFALILVLYGMGWNSFRQLIQIGQQVFDHAGASSPAWQVDAIGHWLGQVLIACLSLLGPLFLTLLITAILVNFWQVGPIFSFKPIQPDFDRINPATGFKRIFSMRLLFEAGKSVLKLAILGSVSYWCIKDALPGMISLALLDPRGYAKALIGLASGILGKLALVMLVLALLDLLYVRYEYAKKLRMSRRDIKDEVKHREGDPRIRSRIRELRKEMLKRSRATAKLPGADVLIVNPTRIAVALIYREGQSGAPQVVAKGAGDLARKMREVAARYQIPVVQNRNLARTLFREVDFDGHVPEKLYPQVAKIMVWVHTVRRARVAAQAPAPAAQTASFPTGQGA